MQGKVQTLATVISSYTRRKSIDTIGLALRSHLDPSTITTEKTVKRDVIPAMKNPFALAKLEHLTEIQCLMKMFCDDHYRYFEKLGSIAIQASCGSGKTLTGIYLMRHLRCKTLIISTRNAVIDQWYTQLHSLYPDLKIQLVSTQRGKPVSDDADVWILTPQYLNNSNRITSDDFQIHPGLIIYDEIHTMLSEGNKEASEKEFLNVLKYPFIRALKKDFEELPYILGMSATYPEKPTNILRVFGKIYDRETSITSIPISLFDLRDCIPMKIRGKCDKLYKALDQYDCVEFYLRNITWKRDGNVIKIPNRDGKDNKDNKDNTDLSGDMKLIKSIKMEPKPKPIELSRELKGVVMTYSIDSSVWAALRIHDLLKADVLLVRTNDEKSYWFPKDKFRYDREEIKDKKSEKNEKSKKNEIIKNNKNMKNKKNEIIEESSSESSDSSDSSETLSENSSENPDVSCSSTLSASSKYSYDRDITISDLKKRSIGIPCEYKDHIDEAEIIVSTTQRMKEGFSNETLVWAIVALFPYSPLSRVQICGRIRRSSKNEKINKAERIVYANSSKVPSTMFLSGSYNAHATVTYSWEFENELFKRENIKYISNHEESKEIHEE